MILSYFNVCEGELIKIKNIIGIVLNTKDDTAVVKTTAGKTLYLNGRTNPFDKSIDIATWDEISEISETDYPEISESINLLERIYDLENKKQILDNKILRLTKEKQDLIQQIQTLDDKLSGDTILDIKTFKQLFEEKLQTDLTERLQSGTINVLVSPRHISNTLSFVSISVTYSKIVEENIKSNYKKYPFIMLRDNGFSIDQSSSSYTKTKKENLTKDYSLTFLPEIQQLNTHSVLSMTNNQLYCMEWTYAEIPCMKIDKKSIDDFVKEFIN